MKARPKRGLKRMTSRYCSSCFKDRHILTQSKTKDILTVAQRIAELPRANAQRQQVVLITQGSSPTVCVVYGLAGHKEIPVLKISTADIVDTTGAG